MKKLINTETRLIGLLGYPLKHSFSPAMQNAAIEEHKLNKLYIPIEVQKKDLDTVVKGISRMNFDGFNVTIPYKVDIIKYLDDIDESALMAGAVNTVVIKSGKMKGFNTDGRGFILAFKAGTSESVQGKKFLVLGGGGAARAITVSLVLNGAEQVFLHNRTHEKALRLVEEISSKIKNSCRIKAVSDMELSSITKESKVIINATSVGMYPNVEDDPIDKSFLQKKHIVCDIVYNPENTKLLETAARIGCKTLSGTGMLVYQGIESFRLWTGKAVSPDTMFRAIDLEKQEHWPEGQH